MARIHVLAQDVARKIAAGEVIERPASVVRELLDNAIDAGAREISVELAKGGIEAIRVVDDGPGMPRDDLELAALPHATSKIASADDLLRARSLGFRGEALASMAAVAELEILSSADGAGAWRLRAGPLAGRSVEAAHGRRGTSVGVTRLFDSFPARRLFLKRPQDELGLCKQAFLDKAAAFPAVAFRLFQDGEMRLFLPAADRLRRVLDCAPQDRPASDFSLLREGSGELAVEIAAGGPAVAKPDRRHIQVFANGRRIQDFGLMKAVERAYEGALPGGLYPFAYVFLAVDGALVDFNIHPAKKEARFKDRAAVEGLVHRCARSFLRPYIASRSAGADAAPLYGFGEWGAGGERSVAEGAGEYATGSGDFAGREDGYRGAEGIIGAIRSGQAATPGPRADAGDFRYLGQVLGVFLVCERGDSVVLVDQHAAHERMIFDSLASGTFPRQELLAPEPLELGEAGEAWLAAGGAAKLDALGFRVERDASGWSLASAPSGHERAAVIVEEAVAAGVADEEDFARRLHARAACKAAIKEGEFLDEASARELCARAFALPQPRCPHGRPAWIEMPREELYRRIGRIVR